MAKDTLKDTPQKGTLQIKVDKAVVKHLSIGLYQVSTEAEGKISK